MLREPLGGVKPDHAVKAETAKHTTKRLYLISRQDRTLKPAGPAPARLMVDSMT
jgi:hypothetical protein